MVTGGSDRMTLREIYVFGEDQEGEILGRMNISFEVSFVGGI